MPRRAGITTRLPIRIDELDSKFRNVRNVKHTRPFKSRKDAQDWENYMREQGYQAHPGGRDPENRKARWRGYTFIHDGRKKKRRE